MKKKILVIILFVILVIGFILTFFVFNKDKKNINDTTTTLERVTTLENIEETTTIETTTEMTTTTVTSENTSSSTTRKTTSKTTAKKIVSKENKEEVISNDSKYGVEIKKVNTYTLITYDDGTTSKTGSKTNTIFDNSNYKATTADLLLEATSLASSEISKIKEMVDFVNKYRSEATEEDIKGCAEGDSHFIGPNGPVTMDATLNKVAMVRVLELSYGGVFQHVRPDGRTCWTAFDEVGDKSSYKGENIAAGNKTVAKTADQWKNSYGHYCNMINGHYTKIGVGVINVPGTKYGTYWVQNFGD